MNPRILRVTGEGQAYVPPDLVVLRFDIEERKMQYETCITSMNTRVDTLRNELVSLGIEKSLLKTIGFSIEPDYVYDDKLKKRMFNGYLSHHYLRLKLDLNRERLNHILDTLTKSASMATMKLGFEVKDKEKFRKLILEDAVKQAWKNAKTIADAADVKIGKTISIDYNWHEIKFTHSVEYSLDIRSPRRVDISPEDISGNDSVTMVWEIV
jgi:hypothetical protein